MSKTLFDISYAVARAVGVVSEGTATGGSTTTVADTVERLETDDIWNGGTAWILYDAGGAGAAPQGEMSVISDFANTGGVVTLRSTLTAAVAAGDRYAVARKRYPLQLIIQKVNEALQKIGPIEITDISTITTASQQTEYTLPSNVLELREVYIQTKLNDTNDYEWNKIDGWQIQKAATGSANLLLLPQFAAGYLIKLVYVGYHATLVSATDKLDDSIHIDRVIYNAAAGCLFWRKLKVGESDPSINDSLNYMQSIAREMDALHPIRQTPRRAKTIDLRFSSNQVDRSPSPIL